MLYHLLMYFQQCTIVYTLQYSRFAAKAQLPKKFLQNVAMKCLPKCLSFSSSLMEFNILANQSIVSL